MTVYVGPEKSACARSLALQGCAVCLAPWLGRRHSSLVLSGRPTFTTWTGRSPAAQLWREAVEAGQHIIWLHTFGERFNDAAKGRPPGQLLAGRPDVQVPVPGRHARHDYLRPRYLQPRPRIRQAGRIGPVSPAAATYEVSGMRIVQHWFDYRKRNARGQRDEPDRNDKMANRWTLAMTEQLRDLIAVLEGCVFRRCFTVGRAHWHGPDSRVSR